MEISLSKYAGFCEGVERAYQMVEKIAKDPRIKKPIYVLGSLVHNEDVVKRIESLGVGKLDVEGTIEEALDKMKSKIGTLVITAHGVGPKVYELAKRKGINLIDTTCPRVVKVQRLAKVFFDRMSQIVIIGEKNHKEVKGIYEWANKKAVFVETKEDLQKIKLDEKRNIAVISQTTQDQEFVEDAARTIVEKYPHAQIIDSICLSTHDRQKEIKDIAAKNDAIVIIGSKESANSTRLWEISKKINNKAYFVRDADELKAEWFKGCGKIGVTAGASTPKWIIDEVLDCLRAIKN